MKCFILAISLTLILQSCEKPDPVVTYGGDPETLAKTNNPK